MTSCNCLRTEAKMKNITYAYIPVSSKCILPYSVRKKCMRKSLCCMSCLTTKIVGVQQIPVLILSGTGTG